MRIPFNLSPDIDYNLDRFFKILPKKNLKVVLSKRDNIIVFDLSFILLTSKIDSIIDKQSCKKNALKACGIGYIEIIFALLIKIIALYI